MSGLCGICKEWRTVFRLFEGCLLCADCAGDVKREAARFRARVEGGESIESIVLGTDETPPMDPREMDMWDGGLLEETA